MIDYVLFYWLVFVAGFSLNMFFIESIMFTIVL